MYTSSCLALLMRDSADADMQQVNGLYQVLVQNSADPQAAPEAVPVEVGLSNGTYTQIVRGLNEGDRVVIRCQY